MNIVNILQLEDLRAAHADINEYGTKVSGFVCGHDGPFDCGHCHHYADEACNHPLVMSDSAVPKNAHGDAKVDADDCCRYWHPRKK